ncbi:uncharacterized protein LOC134095751 [Sardina pilchardus]|uniref:uncharacterized protein LOC134095751 n=1 Tax=Sardina pilchardus TaxID=27697 RepID=UPI002E15C1E1
MAPRSSSGEQTQRPLWAESHTSVLLPLMVMMMMTMSAHEQSVCDTDTATCSGEAGRPVYLQLIKDTKEHEVKLFRDNTRVFTYKGSKSVFFEEFNTTSVLQRWHFVPDNGTMIINPAERRDAGTYRVEIFKEGKSVGDPHTVQLIIEGVNPVVPVLVTLVLLLMCVCGGVFYFYWRKNAHTRTHTTAAPEELHYAVVDITHRRQEDYEPSGHTQDCVYAQVQPRQ